MKIYLLAIKRVETEQKVLKFLEKLGFVLLPMQIENIRELKELVEK